MSAAALAVEAAGSEPRPSPHLALSRLLDDLASVLVTISPQAYVGRPLPGVSGSIGEHVRHTLDHIAAFVSMSPGTTLSYDRRERGTAVERDTGAALRMILRLKAALGDGACGQLENPVAVTSLVSESGASVTGWSSVARELAFVISHTVHHQALIAVLLTIQDGCALPEAFGYAPSTPRNAD